MYREGMFYKCYDEDAMVFSQHIKAYHVSAKHVKSAGSDVLSLGFPGSLVGKGAITSEGKWFLSAWNIHGPTIGYSPFALACKHSFEKAVEGYVAFDSKTVLIDYYWNDQIDHLLSNIILYV